jgi:hypothetical protein
MVAPLSQIAKSPAGQPWVEVSSGLGGVLNQVAHQQPDPPHGQRSSGARLAKGRGAYLRYLSTCQVGGQARHVVTVRPRILLDH